MQLKVQSMKEVEREIKEPVKEKIIFNFHGSQMEILNNLIRGGGSYHNCPPGYDNEGNITPNQNF